MADKIISICNRIIEYSFYLLFLLVPLIFTPWNFELFEFNKMILTYLLTIVIVASFLLKSILEKEIRINRTPLDVPILLFLGSLLISTAYSIDPHTSIWGYYSRSNGGLMSIISYIALYYVFVSSLDLKKVYRTLIVSLLSGFVVTLWGLPSHAGFDPTCLLFQGRFDTTCWTEQFKPEIRIFSTLGQPNWLAAYLSILIPIAIAFGIKNSKFQARNTKQYQNKNVQMFKKVLDFGHSNLFRISIFGFSAFLFYLALLYTGSRSGFAGLSVGFLSLLVSFKLTIPYTLYAKRYLLAVLATLSVVTFLVGTPFEQINKFTLQGIRSHLPMTNDQRPTTEPQGPALETGGTESGEIRKIVWQGAIDIARHYPLFGSGVETFAYSYYQFRPIEHNLTSEWDFLYNKAHNEYLNYLATTGFVGLGTYLLMIGVFLFFAIGSLISKHEARNPKQYKNSNALISKLFGISNFNISNLSRISNFEFRILTLALLASYLSILVSNFFGFSVVITNLYLFLIPAFVFVLNGTVNTQKTLAILLPKNIFEPRILKIFNMQTVSIFFLLLATSYALLTMARFWLADVQYANGYSLDRAGQYPSAYRPLLNSLVLRPNEPTFQAELAFNNAMLATFFGEDAISSAQLVQNATYLSDLTVKEHPNNVSFWKDRARIFYALSDLDETHIKDAISSLEKAKELAPTDAKIFYNLAVLYSQHDRTDEAIKTLTETVKLKPDYRDAYFALGLFYHEKGDRQRAIEQMEYILNKIASSDAEAKERLTGWRGY